MECEISKLRLDLKLVQVFLWGSLTYLELTSLNSKFQNNCTIGYDLMASLSFLTVFSIEGLELGIVSKLVCKLVK